MADLDIDFTGIRNMFQWVERFDDRFDTFNHDFTQQAGLKALRMTKQLTPVGDHPNDVAFWARKKAGSSELNLVELHGAGEGVVGGTLRRSWDVKPVVKRGADYDVTIYTDAKYAPYVEHGHRTVAFNSGGRTVGWWEGYHMAARSIDKVQQGIPLAYERAFTNFLRSLGVIDG